MDLFRIDTNSLLPVRLKDGESISFRFQHELATGFEVEWHNACTLENGRIVEFVNAPCTRSLGMNYCVWCTHPDECFARTMTGYCFLARTHDSFPVLVCFKTGTKDARRLSLVVSYVRSHEWLQHGVFTLVRSGTGLETEYVLLSEDSPKETKDPGDTDMIPDYLLRIAQQRERKST